MKHRLMPFSRCEQSGETLTLLTPDSRVEGLPSVYQAEVERLRREWCEPTPLSSKLLAAGAVVDDSLIEYRLLARLEEYFRSNGHDTWGIRLGAHSKAAEPVVPQYLAQLVEGSSGLGADESRPLAFLKAAVELYERYACSVLRNEELIYAEPHGVVIEPPLYAFWQRQLPGFPFVAAPSGAYVDATDPVLGQTVSAPAELVFNPYYHGAMCGDASSNGVAAHPDRDTALLKSAYELVERDALMFHWFRGLRREQIEPPEAFRDRVARLEELQFEVRFINLTLEVAPVILAIARRPRELHPRLTLGMGCASTPKAAMAKALEEIESMITFVDVEPAAALRAESDVTTVMDHHTWYSQGDNSDAVMEMVGPDVCGLHTVVAGPSTVPQMHAKLHEHDLRWHAIDLNLSGAEQTGVHVIRSMIPGLIPISFGYKMEPLGHPRLLRPFWEGVPRRCTSAGYRIQPFA